MKRLGLLAGFLLCAGCFTAAPPADIVAPAPVRAAKAFPPVLPDGANESNGHQTAKMLEDEINRDYQEIMLTTSPR